MGTHTSGIAFQYEKDIEPIVQLVKTWSSIPDLEQKDTLTTYDENGLYIKVYPENIIAIFNHELSQSCLTEHSLWESRFSELGVNWSLAFANYDSSDYYAYCTYANGKFLSSAKYDDESEKVICTGTLSEEETKWLNAPVFYEHSYMDDSGNVVEELLPESKVSLPFDDWEAGNYFKIFKLNEEIISEHGLVSHLTTVLSGNNLGFDIVHHNEPIKTLYFSSKKLQLETETKLETPKEILTPKKTKKSWWKIF